MIPPTAITARAPHVGAQDIRTKEELAKSPRKHSDGTAGSSASQTAALVPRGDAPDVPAAVPEVTEVSQTTEPRRGSQPAVPPPTPRSLAETEDNEPKESAGVSAPTDAADDGADNATDGAGTPSPVEPGKGETDETVLAPAVEVTTTASADTADATETTTTPTPAPVPVPVQPAK